MKEKIKEMIKEILEYDCRMVECADCDNNPKCQNCNGISYVTVDCADYDYKEKNDDIDFLFNLYEEK